MQNLIENSTAQETPAENSDRRNILDKFRGWENDMIKNCVQANTINAAVAMFHLNGDFNISTLLRNTNFFGFKECIYIGKRQWDRRGAVGTQNYSRLTHFANEEDFWQYVNQNYTVIAIENNIEFEIENLYSFNFPSNPLFLFGEEGCGLSNETLSRAAKIVQIPNFGSVRSLNVGTASGIIMSEYRKFLYKNS